MAPWCMGGGGVNTIRFPSERKGGSRFSSQMQHRALGTDWFPMKFFSVF